MKLGTAYSHAYRAALALGRPSAWCRFYALLRATPMPAALSARLASRIVPLVLALLLAACGACGGEDTTEPEPTAWPSITARDGAATLTVDYVCDGHGGTARVSIRTVTEQITRPTPYTCGDWSSLTVFDVPCGTEVVGWVEAPGEAPVYAGPVVVECAP